MQFIIHIIIFALIFSILSCWFRFFIKIKWNCDYSYIAIVMFSSYISAILNTKFWISMFGTFWISLLCTIPFALLVFLLSKRLNDFYFSIGTLSFYILIYQLAYNTEFLTNWAYGVSNIKRFLIWDFSILWNEKYLILMLIISAILFGWLYFFKKTSTYKNFIWRWENELSLKSLWISSNKSKLLIICLSALLATIAWSCYTFYYCYISPSSFWFSTLILILIIVFISYKYNEFGVVLVSVIILALYEGLRFIKFVDPSRIWYFREIIFSLIVIVIAFLTFKKFNFWREQ